MFIKAVKKRNPGGRTEYTYHRLVESYRTSRGPRHMTVLNLGRLDLPKEKWKSLADRIDQIASAQQPLVPVEAQIEELAQHFAPLVLKRNKEKESADERQAEKPDYQRVDLKSIEHKGVRTVGAEYVGWQYFRRLKIDKILKGVGLSEEQIEAAALLIVGRLVAPASERATLGWAQHNSAVAELIGTRIREISESSLYRVTDKLFEQKEQIESLLRGEEKQLFELSEKIILYDLTNTYFEGSRYESELIGHGKSKDRRNDCPLITLGLVIDEWGFVKRSEFFAGAPDEPESLRQMLKQLGGGVDSTVVMDAGIATKENLEYLRAQGFEYVCVSRGKALSAEEEQAAGEVVTIKAERKNKIEGQLLKRQDEWVLICDSEQRKVKEQAMKERFQQRYEEGLEAIKASLSKKGGTKRYAKVLERIGRLKEKSHGFHQYYEIEIEHEEDTVTAMRWSYSKPAKAEGKYSGRYYIRTSRTDLNEKEIWKLYVTLTGIEDSFRSLKSELGMRPVYHYVDRRIKAHIFITVLAYHLLNAIRFRLRAAGYLMRWSTVRARLSTHVLASISMKTDEGRTVYIRTPSTPELFHRDIYRALELRPSPIRRRKTIK